MTSKRDVVLAAVTLAEDAETGRLNPAELSVELAESCKALFGTVVGGTDPLFGLQIDVARQVLAIGGISADEVAEWAAVLRQRAERTAQAPAAASEPARPSTDPGERGSSASGPHSPENGSDGSANTVVPQNNTYPDRHSDETGDDES